MTTETHVTCQCAMIAAPGSRQGKTIFTAALARVWVQQGKSVKIIKLGPDYLDPMILETASRQPVCNLDWWMMGEKHCRQLFADAVASNDVVLIESMMGLHDNAPSSAWIARQLGVPVILIMNLAKFAQTSTAIVHGMKSFGPAFVLHGVVGNLLGSQHHHTLVAEAMKGNSKTGEHYLGSIRRDERMHLPERHLGLVQSGEIDQLDARLDQAAECLREFEIDIQLPNINLFEADDQTQCYVKQERSLEKKRIAIAKDTAFSFIYPANLSVLENLGAELIFFSPLTDLSVPDCDAIWLPGGYPELHLSTLSRNKAMLKSINEVHNEGKAIYAECGGMMYLGETITDIDKNTFDGCNIIAANFTMKKRFQHVGYQQLCVDGKTIRGHSFHHSSMSTKGLSAIACQRQDESPGESFYISESLKFGYSHFYFPSCIELVLWIFTTSP